MQALFASYATTSIEDGTNILTWLQTLGDKYSDLPGVRNLHDFLFVKAQDSKVVLKVCEFCFGGVWNVSPLHQKNTTMSEIPVDTYKDKCWHQISDDKMAHIVTMYNGFIPPDRCPEFLPPIPVQSQPQPQNPPSHHQSIQLTQVVTQLVATKRQRRKGTCSVPGCTGEGHKNKERLHECHTTRAGCPKLRT